MTNLKFKNKNKLSYSFLRIMNKLSEMDKKTRYYGTDQILYEGEIHMIKAIKENEGISVTRLADILGITKGAVSQMIAKLKKKDMIVKEADPSNLSRLILHLSDKGEIAYEHHEKLHEHYEEVFHNILKDADINNRVFLEHFFQELEKQLDQEAKEDN